MGAIPGSSLTFDDMQYILFSFGFIGPFDVIATFKFFRTNTGPVLILIKKELKYQLE